MDPIPDVLLRDVLSFLPSKSFLPVSHVSRRFRSVWLGEDRAGDDDEDDSNETDDLLLEDERKPAAVDLSSAEEGASGELSEDQREREDKKMDTSFQPVESSGASDAAAASASTSAAGLRAVGACGDNSACNVDESIGNSSSIDGGPGKSIGDALAPPRNKRLTSPLQIGNLFKSPWNKPAQKSLNISLLQYYIENGWEGTCRMKRVLTGAAARGDIEGMEYIFDNDLYPETDVEICTVAAAAGQLEAVKWLREVRNMPWDPTDVHRESSENLHDDVMDYVEKNSLGHEIQLSYGVGLPW